MIIALDIETMADAERVAAMPEPEVKLGNLVDPVKIRAKKDEAKAEQLASAALSPMTGRVICAGMVFGMPSDRNNAIVLPAVNDATEFKLLQFVFDTISDPECRLITFNGAQFDLPFIYRRAMMLGVEPKHFGAPPLTTWTKRYGNDRHIDLLPAWCGSDSTAAFKGNSLGAVAQAILGETREEEEYEKFPEMMQTAEGRAHIEAACLHHTELTYRIYERALGTLF